METTEGRITGECMRIAVVSTPRTCSSMLGTLMVHKYNLLDYSEIFAYNQTSPERGTEILEKLKTTDNFTVKITSTSFYYHTDIMTPDTFPWEIFDKIILAEREDLAKQIASWMLLSYSQQSGYHDHNDVINFLREQLKTVENIPFSESNFNYAIRDIDYFYSQIKPSLKRFGDKVKVVKHEMLQTNPENYLEELGKLLDIQLSIEDIMHSNLMSRTELDYTPFIDYYTLHEKIYATKEENNNTERADTIEK